MKNLLFVLVMLGLISCGGDPEQRLLYNENEETQDVNNVNSDDVSEGVEDSEPDDYEPGNPAGIDCGDVEWVGSGDTINIGPEDSVRAFEELQHITKAKKISITGLDTLNFLSNLKCVEHLNLRDVKVSDLSALENLVKATSIAFDGLETVINLNSLKSLRVDLIKYVVLMNMPALRDLSIFSENRSLRRFAVINTAIEDLYFLDDIEELDNLEIISCHNVKDFRSISHITKINNFNVSENLTLNTLNDLVNLREVGSLYVVKNPNLPTSSAEWLAENSGANSSTIEGNKE